MYKLYVPISDIYGVIYKSIVLATLLNVKANVEFYPVAESITK